MEGNKGEGKDEIMPKEIPGHHISVRGDRQEVDKIEEVNI